MKREDLIKCDLQYEIRHHSTDAFKVGEKVFLKSSPEWPLTVVKVGAKQIVCEWKNMYGSPQQAQFAPETILQYRYSALLIWRGISRICLN